jgi:hypothetical protein
MSFFVGLYYRSKLHAGHHLDPIGILEIGNYQKVVLESATLLKIAQKRDKRLLLIFAYTQYRFTQLLSSYV